LEEETMTQQIHDPRYATPQPTFPPPGGYGQPAPPFGPPPGGFGPPPGGFGPPPPPAPRRRTGAIVGSIIGALVLIGGLAVGALFLFGGKVLDTAEAERQLARLTEEQVGLAAEDVRCPDDVPLAAGTTTTCTATLDGQAISFTVEQTDDTGNVQITSDNGFVVVADVEASLAEQVGAEAEVEATATCDAEGHSVLVDGAGTPIPCTVSNAADASDSIDVFATVGEDGTVSYEVV
jgi:Domain of unknown function (DUF4333)